MCAPKGSAPGARCLPVRAGCFGFCAAVDHSDDKGYHGARTLNPAAAEDVCIGGRAGRVWGACEDG